MAQGHAQGQVQLLEGPHPLVPGVGAHPARLQAVGEQDGRRLLQPVRLGMPIGRLERHDEHGSRALGGPNLRTGHRGHLAQEPPREQANQDAGSPPTPMPPAHASILLPDLGVAHPNRAVET